MAIATLDALYTRHGHALVSRARAFAAEIGDTKASEFLPQIKLGRLDNEFNLSCRWLHDAPKATVEEHGRAIEYIASDGVICRMYDTGGGYEQEVEWAHRPDSNVVRFSLRRKGLEFLPQGTIEDDHAGEGLSVSRPEHVVQSFALYFADPQKRHNQYRAGKFGHVYRPYAHDAAGHRVWCLMALSVDQRELTITVPQEFLDTAVYPVVVDPNFGDETAGASRVTLPVDFVMGAGETGTAGYAAPASGTIDSVSIYCDSSGAAISITFGVYDQGSSVPGSLVGDSDAFVINRASGGGEGWETRAVAGSITSAATYYPAQDHDSASIGLYYDSVTDALKYVASTYSAGTLPASFPGSPTPFSGRISAYITYTASGGARASKNMRTASGTLRMTQAGSWIRGRSQ